MLIVTSGPGGTNTITPMQDALMDGTPLVVLTGQVPRIMQVRAHHGTHVDPRVPRKKGVFDTTTPWLYCGTL